MPWNCSPRDQLYDIERTHKDDRVMIDQEKDRGDGRFAEPYVVDPLGQSEEVFVDEESWVSWI